MIINNLIDQVTEELNDYWKLLREEYGTRIEFIICLDWEYVRFKHSMLSAYTDDANALVNELKETEEKGSMIETLVSFDMEDDERNIKVTQRVVMKMCILDRLILKNIGRIDLLINYLKQSLRHEMGHVLCNIEMYDGKSIEEWIKIRTEIINDTKREMQNMQDIHDPNEWLTAYFNLPEERMANDRVGIKKLKT